MFAGSKATGRHSTPTSTFVVIATPPGFKPQQFEAAVEKGVHVFMEKPVATDAPGVRRVLEANEDRQAEEPHGRHRPAAPPPRRSYIDLRQGVCKTARSATSTYSASTGTVTASGTATEAAGP